MFVEKHFTYNGVYTRDINLMICHFDDDEFHKMRVDYVSEVKIENDANDYSPFYSEEFSTPDDITLNLIMYNPDTMKALKPHEYDMEALHDFLIGDGGFNEFISDDDREVIYYFKPIKISKMLTFDGTGYLEVVFKPYSKYCYRRKERFGDAWGSTTGEGNITIFNPSRKVYRPIIELTNNGNTSTINKIEDFTIAGLENGEKVIIDNQMMTVVNENGENRFKYCNREWVKLPPKETVTLNVSGNCTVRVICEFPIIK